VQCTTPIVVCCKSLSKEQDSQTCAAQPSSHGYGCHSPLNHQHWNVPGTGCPLAPPRPLKCQIVDAFGQHPHQAEKGTMINKNTSVSCTSRQQQEMSMAGRATTAAATCWGRSNYCHGCNGGSNLLGGGTLFPSQCQWWWLKAIGGSGGSSGQRLAADNSVDGGGRQQRGSSFPVVVGGSKAIVDGQWIMAG
jgi:hypothetical protein